MIMIIRVDADADADAGAGVGDGDGDGGDGGVTGQPLGFKHGLLAVFTQDMTTELNVAAIMMLH